jgi:hypothetical protein
MRLGKMKYAMRRRKREKVNRNRIVTSANRPQYWSSSTGIEADVSGGRRTSRNPRKTPLIKSQNKIRRMSRER